MFKIALNLLAIYEGVAAFNKIEKEKGVSLLKDSNFEREVSKHDFYMVLFTSNDNCEECDKISAPFARAARNLLKKDPAVEFGKVDVKKSQKLARRFNVIDLPQMFWLVEGTESQYNGGLAYDEIVEWVTKRTVTPFEKISCTQIDERIIEDKVNAIYFGDQEGKLFE